MQTTIEPAARHAIEPQARHAIEQLVHEHAWLIDHGQADRVTALYAEDARVFGIGPDMVGHDAIGAWAGQRAAMTERRSRHVQSNIRLVAVSPDRVLGCVLLTLYRHDGDGKADAKALMVAEYDDVYQRGKDAVWRFAERRLTVLFGG